MNKYLDQQAYVKDANGVTILHGKVIRVYENPMTGELEITVYGQQDRSLRPIPSSRDDISRIVEG